MSKRLLCLLSALVLILLAAAAAASSWGTSEGDNSVMTLYVYTDNHKGLNVRSSPVVGNNIIGLAPFGTALQVIRFLDNGWACIQWARVGEAYVQSRFLQWYSPSLIAVTPTAVPTAAPTAVPYAPTVQDNLAVLNAEFRTARLVTPFTVLVRPSRASGWVNLRWAPSTGVEVLSTYRSGDQLTVIAETQSWYQVTDPKTGAVGYMMKNYTTRQY